jgi:hypothetical protein
MTVKPTTPHRSGARLLGRPPSSGRRKRRVETRSEVRLSWAGPGRVTEGPVVPHGSCIHGNGLPVGTSRSTRDLQRGSPERCLRGWSGREELNPGLAGWSPRVLPYTMPACCKAAARPFPFRISRQGAELRQGAEPVRPAPAFRTALKRLQFSGSATPPIGAASKPPNDGDNLVILAVPRRCLDVA